MKEKLKILHLQVTISPTTTTVHIKFTSNIPDSFNLVFKTQALSKQKIEISYDSSFNAIINDTANSSINTNKNPDCYIRFPQGTKITGKSFVVVSSILPNEQFISKYCYPKKEQNSQNLAMYRFYPKKRTSEVYELDKKGKYEILFQPQNPDNTLYKYYLSIGLKQLLNINSQNNINNHSPLEEMVIDYLKRENRILK